MEWNGIKEETASVSLLLMLFLFLNSKFTHERRKEVFFFFSYRSSRGSGLVVLHTLAEILHTLIINQYNLKLNNN